MFLVGMNTLNPDQSYGDQAEHYKSSFVEKPVSFGSGRANCHMNPHVREYNCDDA